MYLFEYLMSLPIFDSRAKLRGRVLEFTAPGAQLPVAVKKFKHRNTKKRKNSK